MSGEPYSIAGGAGGAGGAGEAPPQLDVALIHFPLSNKNQTGLLPPDLTQGGAAYLSAQLPANHATLTMYISGWGQTDDLRFTFAPPFKSGEVAHVTDPIQPPWNGAFVCHGDSGGPLFRTVQFAGLTRTIVAGILSRSDPAPNGACAMFGDHFTWTRVDTPSVQAWIKREMARWYGQAGLSSKEAALCGAAGLPGTIGAFACWGKPCHSQSECGAGEACRGAADDVTGGCAKGLCSDSDNPTSCDCLVGQCLATAGGKSKGK